MAVYVVCSRDLRQLVGKWEQLVNPNNFKYNCSLFDHLAESGFQRIQWFYYCDNVEGVTIRLYDRQFENEHPKDFMERDNVILRGHDLGPDDGELKAKMLRCFDKRHRMKKFGKSRYEFFERQNVGPILPPPPEPEHERIIRVHKPPLVNGGKRLTESMPLSQNNTVFGRMTLTTGGVVWEVAYIPGRFSPPKLLSWVAFQQIMQEQGKLCSLR